MNQIWAPWRMDYILGPKDRACFLCSPNLRRALDRENHILFRGPTCAVVLNRYPYIGGHLMVAPYRHVDGLDGMQPEERTEMMELANRCILDFEKGHVSRRASTWASTWAPPPGPD
jgi:ATP adenylyltransferase